MSLAHRNLNLLVVLDALAEAGGVAGAATLLGVTPSAVSHSLRSLRSELDDPVLVKGAGGTFLTPRAERVARGVRDGLRLIDRALEDPGGFDPQTSSWTYRIAGADYFAVALLPRWLEHLRRTAPGVSLLVTPSRDDAAQRLETGDVDLVVSTRIADRPGLKRRSLFGGALTCLVRKDHPALDAAPDGVIDLDTFCTLDHILIAPAGRNLRGPVDSALEELGRSRRVVVAVPWFSAAPLLVASTDCLLTLPKEIAAPFVSTAQVVELAPPVELPAIPMFMAWHERFDAEDAHTFLRNSVVAAAETSPPDERKSGS